MEKTLSVYLTMKYSKTFICIVAAFLITKTTLNAQTVRYKIFKGRKQIGNIIGLKETSSAKTTFTITSKASVRIITKFVRETFVEANYIGEKLESSDAKETINDELKQHRITQRQGSKYICIDNREKEKFNLEKQIKFCSSMLYFMEPKNQTHIFAESYQVFCPIEMIEPGIYKITLPQGKINHYIYKLGVLEEIRVFRTLFNLVFKRE